MRILNPLLLYSMLLAVLLLTPTMGMAGRTVLPDFPDVREPMPESSSPMLTNRMWASMKVKDKVLYLVGFLEGVQMQYAQPYFKQGVFHSLDANAPQKLPLLLVLLDDYFKKLANENENLMLAIPKAIWNVHQLARERSPEDLENEFLPKILETSRILRLEILGED